MIASNHPTTEKPKQTELSTKIAPLMKITCVLAFIITIYDFHSTGLLKTAFNSTSFLSSKFWWFKIFVHSIPHLIYYFIWTYPKTYRKVCINDCVHPVDLTFAFVFSGKVLQFVTCSAYYLYINSFFLGEKASFGFTPTRLVTGTFIFLFGQWLNMAVWEKLGVDGVCYGIKLGRPVPWVEGFPYNVGISNPQYFGATLSVFGIVILLANEIAFEAGLLHSWIVLAVFYVFSSYVETYTSQNHEKED